MFNRLINNIYPYLSLGVIQFGTWLENGSNLLNLFVFLLQGIIGFLTVVKLYKDIKSKKFKSIEKTEKEVIKKHPFLVTLFQYLTKFKK